MEQKEVGMKVEIPAESTSPGGSSSHHHHHHHHGLTRQPSTSKGSCLCSPTTHAGSFRCRLHRAPSLHRTKSMDPAPASSKPDASGDHN